jgi:hypothetical protein
LSRYTLTIRHGSDVDRERFDSVDAAVDALRTRAEAIRAEGGVGETTMIRTYAPGDQVHARLELSGSRGLLRRREAGLDVMGNGRLVPYRGAVRKKQLEPASGQSPYEVLREALGG